MPEKILISIVGQTAIGKTQLAIALAKHYQTEIISADSRQFYQEMTIGTAVPSKEELNEVRHHFVQHKSIFDFYSVGDFENEAIKVLNDLFQKNKIVIMVGGSGLYVDTVTKGLDDFPEVSSDIRASLNQKLEKEGIESLQKELESLDPLYFENVDLNNPHRLIRALEICIGSGKTYSSFLGAKKKIRTFETVTVGLKTERHIVYERINARVDLMIKQGLVEEVRSLIPHKNLNALQTVGYKELFEYFNGLWQLDFAISEIKKNTRRFAKRQMTWFKKNDRTIWFDHEYDLGEVVRGINTRIDVRT